MDPESGQYVYAEEDPPETEATTNRMLNGSMGVQAMNDQQQSAMDTVWKKYFMYDPGPNFKLGVDREFMVSLDDFHF